MANSFARSSSVLPDRRYSCVLSMNPCTAGTKFQLNRNRGPGLTNEQRIPNLDESSRRLLLGTDVCHHDLAFRQANSTQQQRLFYLAHRHDKVNRIVAGLEYDRIGRFFQFYFDLFGVRVCPQKFEDVLRVQADADFLTFVRNVQRYLT